MKKCLYNQTERVGFSDEHYSVYQVVEWLDLGGNLTAPAKLKNFTIIWDYDHDERILDVVDSLYLNGLLHPVLFAGESEGVLRLVLDSNCHTPSDYQELVLHTTEKALEPSYDVWTLDVEWFDDSENNEPFLRDIYRRWRIGHGGRDEKGMCRLRRGV